MKKARLIAEKKLRPLVDKFIDVNKKWPFAFLVVFTIIIFLVVIV